MSSVTQHTSLNNKVRVDVVDVQTVSKYTVQFIKIKTDYSGSYIT
jgi:hypothetical protein